MSQQQVQSLAYAMGLPSHLRSPLAHPGSRLSAGSALPNYPCVSPSPLWLAVELQRPKERLGGALGTEVPAGLLWEGEFNRTIASHPGVPLASRDFLYSIVSTFALLCQEAMLMLGAYKTHLLHISHF